MMFCRPLRRPASSDRIAALGIVELGARLARVVRQKAPAEPQRLDLDNRRQREGVQSPESPCLSNSSTMASPLLSHPRNPPVNKVNPVNKVISHPPKSRQENESGSAALATALRNPPRPRHIPNATAPASPWQAERPRQPLSQRFMHEMNAPIPIRRPAKVSLLWSTAHAAPGRPHEARATPPALHASPGTLHAAKGRRTTNAPPRTTPNSRPSDGEMLKRILRAGPRSPRSQVNLQGCFCWPQAKLSNPCCCVL